MMQQASILPLAVHELGFVADHKRLLDAVSFTLPSGGVTALIGPNGAGKSLTLRLCQGLLAPTSGSVRWQGHGTARRASPRHALVFQRPVMLRRSVAANIRHALGVTGAGDIHGRTASALARFGLADLARRPARLLSGGEQQRLAIARAWVLEPEVLLLDEPTAQLDPGATGQIEALIAALVADGMTILMTTHDLGQARRMASRVLFMHRGRLLEDAAAEAFFAGPHTAEARTFIAGGLLW
jgi:tungstate transport system ATP-binding protein